MDYRDQRQHQGELPVMQFFAGYKRRVSVLIFLATLLQGVVLIGAATALYDTDIAPLVIYAALLIIACVWSYCTAVLVGKRLASPTGAIAQAVAHVAPETAPLTPAPQTDSLHFGRELAATLISQIYELANSAAHITTPATTNFVESNLPLPLFILDNSETITFANHVAAEYVGQQQNELIGKNIYMVLDLSFPSEDTLDVWLNNAKEHSATASSSWERVRMSVLDNHPTRLFDLAAYYNRDNPDGQETMLVLFDHTKQYSQDEQAVSFMALSVHELRTPLTLLRGYIEALDEELDGKLDPQMTDFMQRMAATAQQLTAFVNNILNVARVDDNQMELHLQKENWEQIVAAAVEALRLRAKVRGIEITTQIQPDLPVVGVDRLSIQEVINNLVDNAIKYSGDGKVINLEAHLNSEGMIETSVRDNGMGISDNIMENLFTKFYRDHRNRAQIGGTGLGLYLSKAIVTAHGGNIWVRSTLGKGSTFTFTVSPYDKLAEVGKNGDTSDIVRGSHGWIKNHSLYRR